MTSRVTLVRAPGDHPSADEGVQKEVADLFAALFPGTPAPKFNAAHSLMAVLAQSPKLALPAAKLSGAVILGSAWGQRANVRELAFQTVALHFADRFSAEARHPNALAAGLAGKHLAAIPDWRNSELFDDEQRLVIEYAQAVVTGRVADDLFARVVARYGEQEAVECTTAIAFWSFWSMIAGAAGL